MPLPESFALRRFPLVAAVLVALTCALSTGRLVAAGKASMPKAGDSFPVLAKENLEGKLPDLEGKVVLVDFWASWCGPCKASFPALKEIHEKYSSQGLTIVAVSIDESKDDMLGFLKKTGVPFVAVRDSKGSLAEKLDIQSIPTSFLIDRTGKILMVHSGYGGDATKKQYIQEIEAALKK